MKPTEKTHTKISWALRVLAATAVLCSAVVLQLCIICLLAPALRFTIRSAFLFCAAVQLPIEWLVYYRFSRFIPNSTVVHRLLQLAMVLAHIGSLLLWLALLALVGFAIGSSSHPV